MSDVDFKFCQDLPKLEVHAHLNGSVSMETIEKLALKSKKKVSLANIKCYEDAFNRFKVLHELVSDVECLTILTDDVIQEFYEDNVFYLELRSTPKSLPNSSKEGYIQTIIDVIFKKMKSHSDLIVTFLVSIDRARSLQDAEENLNLALKYNKLYPEIVVGIDLSGNPKYGEIQKLIPYLKLAKENGLKVIPHVGEMRNDSENLILLSCAPDRVGHACFIHPDTGGSEDLLGEITTNKTPIEICLSSNIAGSLFASFLDHPIHKWYSLQHPIVLCTDDKGLFDVTLSNEYFTAAQTLQLNRLDLWKLSFKAIEYISASDFVKLKLKDQWMEKFKKLNLITYSFFY